MSRKHTKRRAHPGLHPLDAITACQPFPEAEITRILLRIHGAYEHLKNGGADDELFDRMAATINVGLIRSEQIGREGEAIFLAAQRALMECDAIKAKHQRYGFTGSGLQVMADAISLYEEILMASTPRQMNDAMEECVRRIRAGHVEVPQGAARFGTAC